MKKICVAMTALCLAVILTACVSIPAKDLTSTQDGAITAGDSSGKKGEPSYKITDTSFSYAEDSIGDMGYYGIIEITNTGSSNLYLKDCTFNLQDKDGHLLQAETFVSSCPDIIRPGEKGYFYRDAFIDEGVSLENGLALAPDITIDKANGDPVDYEVSDVSIRQDMFGPKVTGRVKNTTEKDDHLLYIQVLYYDGQGKVIAITGTTVTGLDAGKQVSFEISGIGLPKAVEDGKYADYKVIARAQYLQF